MTAFQRKSRMRIWRLWATLVLGALRPVGAMATGVFVIGGVLLNPGQLARAGNNCASIDNSGPFVATEGYPSGITIKQSTKIGELSAAQLRSYMSREWMSASIVSARIRRKSGGACYFFPDLDASLTFRLAQLPTKSPDDSHCHALHCAAIIDRSIVESEISGAEFDEAFKRISDRVRSNTVTHSSTISHALRVASWQFIKIAYPPGTAARALLDVDMNDFAQITRDDVLRWQIEYLSKFDNPAVTKDSDGATAEARNSQDCAAPKFRALDIGVISNTDWSDSDLVMFNYTREFDAKIVQKFCSTMASLKPPKHRFLSHLNSTDKVGCVFTKIQSGDNWIALFVDRIGERTLDLEKMLAAGSSLMREPSSCGNVFSKSLIARLRSNDSFLIAPTSPH